MLSVLLTARTKSRANGMTRARIVVSIGLRLNPREVLLICAYGVRDSSQVEDVGRQVHYDGQFRIVRDDCLTLAHLVELNLGSV
jgi:hypothetical protein